MFIPLTVGGGVHAVEDIRALLNAGADKVSINTAAVQDPELFDEAASRFGSQCIVAAIDAKQCAVDAVAGRASTAGARPPGIDAVEWAAEVVERGAGEILLTSMDRDGTKSGFDLELTRAVAEAVDVPVIASGGVGTLRAPVRGHPRRPRGRCAGGLDLPLRRVHDPAGEGGHARRRRRGSRLTRRRPDARVAPGHPARPPQTVC